MRRRKKIVRIPITNVFAGGDYTGPVFVGASRTRMNVLLDTGSSAFAIDGNKFRPQVRHGDIPTRLAQYSDYADHSGWTGAVLKMDIAIGRGSKQVTLKRGNIAVSTKSTRSMFGRTDGILGLAYIALDDAYAMRAKTWPGKYSRAQVKHGRHRLIRPCLIQLARAGVVSDRFAFHTKRSEVHRGMGDAAKDPLNQGWLVIGGGEECRDLYTGGFQVAKVFAREYYNTKLKSVAVGKAPPIAVHARAPAGDYTNSIVDSGTNSIDFDPALLNKVLAAFPPAQRKLLRAGMHDRGVRASLVDLRTWPDLTFVLAGTRRDVTLIVRPRDYWQVNAPRKGAAKVAITRGSAGQTILGLPVMSAYFTVFDGEARRGWGVVKFATRRG